jgi:cytochrome oxidase assembly protein ShyY1
MLFWVGLWQLNKNAKKEKEKRKKERMPNMI